MLRNQDDVSRRSVLKMAGTTAAAITATGLAAAAPNDTVKVNVGYTADSGERATLDAADEVVSEYKFDAVTIRTTKAAADTLSKRADVRYVEEDKQMETLAQTLPWGIDRVDADVAHANGDTGSGVDVGIIDTGIDSDHPDLQANLGKGKAFEKCKGRNCKKNWDDDNDHGTHVAGTVDAVDNSEGVVGVSTDATIHAVKVCDKSGFCDSSAIANGIEYVADQGWDVANISLGGDYSSIIDDAGQYAYNNGVLLVSSAGNDGECTDCVGYPAANEEFMAVSATSCDDTLASFSSTGPEVEIAGPGENVYSTIPGGYDTFSGTSMSSPHVAGAGAQVMATGESNTQARDTLKSTAENIGLADNEQGAGLVDVAAALGLDSSDEGTGDGPNC